ncbi:MAG TPA: CAP domain-containing protein [Candidatus Paceibacterota bacterium]|nr:CAP domain-containing protein [Candidatus Paceibacterota bacterium]
MRTATAKRLWIIVASASLFVVACLILNQISAYFTARETDSENRFHSSSTDSLGLNKSEYEITDSSERALPREVLVSSPLVVWNEESVNELQAEIVVEETNRVRTDEGVAALSQNATLARSAARKVEDMFQKQYFEHVSPEGSGADSFVKEVGYEYVSIGENLALGQFKNEADLVRAWMESPGHRENILRAQFQEIGVAVGYGLYEGKQVLIAVQHFGRPLTSCPEIHVAAKEKIDTLQPLLEKKSMHIDELEEKIKQIEAEGRTDSNEYSETFKAYDEAVASYNATVQTLRYNTSAYNDSVRQFNECIKSSR